MLMAWPHFRCGLARWSGRCPAVCYAWRVWSVLIFYGVVRRAHHFRSGDSEAVNHAGVWRRHEVIYFVWSIILISDGSDTDGKPTFKKCVCYFSGRPPLTPPLPRTLPALWNIYDGWCLNQEPPQSSELGQNSDTCVLTHVHIWLLTQTLFDHVTLRVSSSQGGVVSRSLALSPVLSAGWVLFWRGGGSAVCVCVCLSVCLHV